MPKDNGSRVPKFIEDAAFAGAGEGSRNDRAFWLAAQCRDARVDKDQADALIGIFARHCNPPLGDKEAANALASAYRAAPRDPPASKSGKRTERMARPPRADADDVIAWDGEIGKHKPATQGIGDPDYVENVPPPSGDPVADLRGWLAALYAPGDKVNYVTSAFLDEDGKWKPKGMGVNRTRADIEADLVKYEKKGHKGEALLRFVLGDWDADSGVWARINPMDGAGSTNSNVVRMDHVLVEGDEQEIGRQLAVIRSLRLPCAAVVHSGGKSVHAVVKVGAGTDKALYAERVAILFKALEDAGLTPDVKCKNSSRLSRLPGPSRAGKPQYLVSGACGAESWDAWLSEQEESEFQAQACGPRDLAQTPEPDNLVGDRFLCRQGSWLLVAQSGVGKSVFAIQAAVSFSVGRDVFGLRVERPLRNLMIQAENNKGDMHEAFAGICAGLGLSDTELADLETNFRTVHCSRYTGQRFAEFVAHLCRAHRPDIVWIDPLLSYLGGEISKMQDTSRFLQNLMQPVIEDANIGLVVVHHTGKPPKGDDAKYKGHDLAYLGIGSSVLTNWARATSTLLRMDDCENRFALEHAKRADRAGCARRSEIMHASGREICWLKAPGIVKEGERPEAEKHRARHSKFDGIGLETMPPASAVWSDDKHLSSEAAERLCQIMCEHGMDGTVKAAAILLKNHRLPDFLTFDKDAQTWQGRLYVPGFN